MRLLHSPPSFGKIGGERSASAWIRTKDQLIKSQLLYQLSYRGDGVRVEDVAATDVATPAARATVIYSQFAISSALTIS
jgi:hypothetical protein